MKKKVCKKCRLFVNEEECPICKGKDFSTNWQGRVNVIDANRSIIAQKTGMNVKGEYAIKIR